MTLTRSPLHLNLTQVPQKRKSQVMEKKKHPKVWLATLPSRVMVNPMRKSRSGTGLSLSPRTHSFLSLTEEERVVTRKVWWLLVRVPRRTNAVPKCNTCRAHLIRTSSSQSSLLISQQLLRWLRFFLTARASSSLSSLYPCSILTLYYRDSEIPEGLARDVIKTHKIVSAAVQKLSKGKSKYLICVDPE